MKAIEVRHISKKFTLYHERARSFQDLWLGMFVSADGAKEDFWALKNVSFSVERGETLGIIGPNGAGKSTLLKLISNILVPTEGEIVVNGRISALLELGAGFHPDLTGRDNIFLNGSILGMSRREMNDRFKQIVDFAELWPFIDTELKRWSVGMVMRLGFSIATSVDPDILITDEILAVGDEAFQGKCLRRIGEIKDEGRTILFVSHDMKAVRDLCTRVIWLDKGVIRADGDVEDVVALYMENVSREGEQVSAE
ncbi:MAG: ABC transporter ATP-binding protein [Anaerolineae bacterium]